MWLTEDEVRHLFGYGHLNENLSIVSSWYYDKAVEAVSLYPNTAMRHELLLKLWEAKNMEVWLAASEE